MTTQLQKEDSLEARWEKAVGLFRAGDKAGALFLFKSLAQDGEPAAYRQIGNIYEQPDGGGVKQDFTTARHWYGKAIEYANDVQGCIGLGRMNYYGKGGPRDFDRALQYYEMVEDKNIPVVNLMLGRMYSLGHGVERNDTVAEQYYRKAIAGGSLVAEKDLALLEIETKRYLRGIVRWLVAVIKTLGLVSRRTNDPRLRSQ